MRSVLVTLAVPPFDYRSPWWWGMDRIEVDPPLHLIAPSPIHRFQKEDKPAGTVHRLNIFADTETDWGERERVEFSVKAYVYLSKLARRGSFRRIVVVDCDGAEPLLAANLSVLAPVWVKAPRDFPSRRGERGRPMLEVAQRVFNLGDVAGGAFEATWTPDRTRWRRIFRTLAGGPDPGG